MQQLKPILRSLLVLLGLSVLLQANVHAETQGQQPQTVRFYAWGGSAEVNAYIQWAKKELAQTHAIELQHVKVADISEAVALLLASEENQTSAIDLLWINGENFAALKNANKLVGDLPAKVPNANQLREDLQWQIDFGTPVEGYELPWGIAQLQLILRNDLLGEQQAVLSPQEFYQLARLHPGRFSYPKPPSFHGTSWLKALAFQLIGDTKLLLEPAEPATATRILQPLWRYLDQLHPHLWRTGEEFPISAGRQRQLYNQGVLDNSITFNPNEVRALQLQQKLAPDARSVSLGNRALTNFHYLAIPTASQRQEAALRVINFLLSPDAQREKAQPQGWADPSVVRLTDTTSLLVASHPEPHVSWNEILEQAWLARYQR